MEKEKIIIFGAGKVGNIVTKMMRYDKEIIFVVDNDRKKQRWLNGYIIYPVNKILEYPGVRIVIAVDNYSSIVVQLMNMGVDNCVYYKDVYGWQYNCKSRQIMDRYISETSVGQFIGRDIKNGWMNHLVCPYNYAPYDKYLFSGVKILDIGCGCGTFLFNELLNGYDAYGIECCKWKIEFCDQKIEDFNFPAEWRKRIIFGYGEKLPFEDNTFDIVTSYYVLEHVNDWRKCLKEMIRVLKPGGVIFLNAPDYRGRYEEHYGIDIGMPICDNVDLLKQVLINNHESLEDFDELNFITKPMVLQELANEEVEVIDREEEGVRVDRIEGGFRIWLRIDLIIRKNKDLL